MTIALEPWERILPADLRTPCFVVDEDRLAANLAGLAGERGREWVRLKEAYLEYIARPDTSTYSVLFIVSGTK